MARPRNSACNHVIRLMTCSHVGETGGAGVADVVRMHRQLLSLSSEVTVNKGLILKHFKNPNP